MKNPHFAKMAEAFGVRGIKCEHKCDVEKTVKEMLAHKGPVVVDFVVEPNEHVYPWSRLAKACTNRCWVWWPGPRTDLSDKKNGGQRRGVAGVSDGLQS